MSINELINKLWQWIRNERVIFGAYLLVVIAVSIQMHLLDASHYNNFLIFRASFFHLISGQTLYGEFPKEYFDIFLYGPFFGVLIAPFAVLPLWAGMFFWILVNAMLVFFAIRALPISQNKKAFIYAFTFLELITALQNVQVNPAIAALMVLAFIFFERKQLFWAAAMICLAVFIKVYGILAAALFLVYPGRGKFLLYCIIWSAILIASPLLFVSPHQLIYLYQEWFNTLVADSKVNIGVSLMGIIEGVFHRGIPHEYIQLIGVCLFLPVYLRFRQYQFFHNRLLLACSAFIWAVIFSHAAESCTYLIAAIGCALWFSFAEKNWLTQFLIILTFILTVLSPSDLFPKYLREQLVVPYSLKALPPVLIWLYIQYQLILKPRSI